jgi:hypothetical protein
MFQLNKGPVLLKSKNKVELRDELAHTNLKILCMILTAIGLAGQLGGEAQPMISSLSFLLNSVKASISMNKIQSKAQSGR